MAPIAKVNGMLKTAERNNFFYGLLMDVARFRKDQGYFIQKQRLHNRLITGTGVVCGLDVAFDPMDPAIAVIRPGVALSDSGREIIVPADHAFDPRQLTDDNG